MIVDEPAKLLDDFNEIREIVEKHNKMDYEDSLEKIRTLIIRQIPLKPIYTLTKKNKLSRFICPNCNALVRSGDWFSGDGKAKICQKCLQALDWSDYASRNDYYLKYRKPQR